MNRTRLHTIALAALSAAVLTACGGGGGDSAPAAGQQQAPTQQPQQPAAPDTSLQSLSAGSYDAASEKGKAFAEINALRLGAGVGAVKQSSQLDTAAQSHADYIFANGGQFTHVESSGQPSYYAATVADRGQRAGYGTNVTEVIGAGVLTPSRFGCVEVLTNSVYHLGAMMSEWRDIGVGLRDDVVQQGMYACTLMLGVGSGAAAQLPAAQHVAVFPLPNAVGVLPDFLLNEVPRPLPSVSGPVGQPIMVSHRQTPGVTITKFTLTKAGNPVPAYILANTLLTQAGPQVTLTADSNVQPGQAFLVPVAPLDANTVYTVTYESSAAPTTTWSFTTR